MFAKLIRDRKKDSERGQNLVEFAMVVPIFLLLVFAIVDFGMGFHAWITITNSAREGARIGAVGADSTTIEARVRDTSDSLQDDRITVVVTNSSDLGGDAGEAVSVKVDYDYELITPISNIMGLLSGSSLGPNINFSSTSEMRLE